MTQRIIIDAVHPEEIRVAQANDERLEDFDIETAAKRQIKSNIYLGKVTRIEPSLQAAFVEYGGNRQGFLPFSEIHFDYFQIPVDDKEALRKAMLQEEEAYEAALEAEEEEEEKTANEGSAEEANAKKKGEEAKQEPAPAAPKKRGRPAKAAKKDAQPAEDASTDASEETPEDESIHREAATENAALSAEEKAEARARADELEKAFAEEFSPASDAASSDPETEEEEEASQARRRQNVFFNQYNIQEVLKRGQILLVQVIKEERGSKGASLSTYISLAGRCCVFMPNTNRAGGISRRIQNGRERKRLRQVIRSFNKEAGSSVIIRTAGTDQSEEDLQQDFTNLKQLWTTIRENTLKAEAPALVYEEGNLITRTLRDLYRNHVEEIIIEGKGAFENATRFLERMAPEALDKLKAHTHEEPVFVHYNMEEQLDQLYDNEVPLPSGGSIVLQPTEALVSIDVNSGRATRERNIEDTALKTNLEAAEEIARQLRLRDLAGLIVIDFIDMRELRNKKAVERTLKSALNSDRAKIQIGRISMFGLLEMSRQRMRSSLNEAQTITCPHCKGAGVVRSEEVMALRLLRILENEASRKDNKSVTLHTSPHMTLHLLNHRRQSITQIEERFDVTVYVEQDSNLEADQYTLPRRRSSSRGRKNSGNARQEKEQASPGSEKKSGNASRSGRKKPADAQGAEAPAKSRRRRSKKSDAQAEGNLAVTEEDLPENIGNLTTSEAGGGQPKKRSRSRKKPAAKKGNMAQGQGNHPQHEETGPPLTVDSPANDLPEGGAPTSEDESTVRKLWKRFTH